MVIFKSLSHVIKLGCITIPAQVSCVLPPQRYFEILILSTSKYAFIEYIDNEDINP